MDRRQFLCLTSTLCAATALAKPVERTSSGIAAPERRITLIATVPNFAAARDAVACAFSSQRMPEQVTVRLRAWCGRSADPELPEMIRFAPRDAESSHVLILDSGGGGRLERIAAKVPPSRLSLTAIALTQSPDGHWPQRTPIWLERDGDRSSVRVPGYWHQQYRRQLSDAAAAADGSQSLFDVEANGHPLDAIFDGERRNMAQVTALAMLAVANGGTAIRPRTLLAELQCVSDRRGLLGTIVETRI